MRGQIERRLARIESRRGNGHLCAFNNEEAKTIDAIARKYLGRDAVRGDIMARGGFMYRITDDEEVVIFNAIRAAVRRGSALTGL